MIETGIADATIENTDPDPERSDETELAPASAPRNLVESEATPKKEAGVDTKTTNETGRESGGTGNGAGVERSTDHGEVGTLNLNIRKTR